MSKVKLALLLTAAFIITTATVGILVFPDNNAEISPPEIAVADETFNDLGITYLPITQGISEYYGLSVENGALVTDITPGSPAALAGVRAGDVILSFNGKRLDGDLPLLGMMMSCPAGNTVTLEVWRAENTLKVDFLHADR